MLEILEPILLGPAAEALPSGPASAAASAASPDEPAPKRAPLIARAPGSWAPILRDPSGKFSLRLRGRLVVDVTNFATDLDSVAPGREPTGSDFSFQRVSLRDARLGVEGDLPARLRYRGEIQFTGDGSIIFNDVFVEYVGKDFAVNVGNTQYVAPLAQSSAVLTFETLERPSLARAFGLGRGLGIAVQKWSEAPVTGYSLSAAWYGLPLSASADTGIAGPYSVAARAIWVPVRNARALVHLGGTFRFRDAREGPDLRFRARPSPGPGLAPDFIDTGFSDLSPAAGRQGPAFRSDQQYFFETILIRGPWSLQAEYGLADAHGNAPAAPRAQFNSFNVQAAWIFTGESRAAAYQPRLARLGRTLPAHPFDQQGPGLWGGHIRLDRTDLNDGRVTGGRQTIATLGINWQPVRNVRLGMEVARSFIRAGADRGGLAGPDARGFSGETTSLVTRLQTDW